MKKDKSYEMTAKSSRLMTFFMGLLLLGSATVLALIWGILPKQLHEIDLILVAGGFLILGLIGTSATYIRFQLTKRPVILLPNEKIENSKVPLDDVNVFAIPKAKHNVGIAGRIALVCFSISLMIGSLFITRLFQAPTDRIPSIVFSILVFLMGILFLFMARKNKEVELLYKKTITRELIIDTKGMRMTVAMVSVSPGTSLDPYKTGYLEVSWDEIASFIVQPSTGSSSTHRSTSSPSCYVIKLKNGRAPVVIGPRKYLYGQEEKIIATIRRFLPVPVTLNDDLH